MNTIYFSVTSCNLPCEQWFLQAGRYATNFKDEKHCFRPGETTARRVLATYLSLFFYRFSSVVNNPIIGNVFFFVC